MLRCKGDTQICTITSIHCFGSASRVVNIVSACPLTMKCRTPRLTALTTAFGPQNRANNLIEGRYSSRDCLCFEHDKSVSELSPSPHLSHQ